MVASLSIVAPGLTSDLGDFASLALSVIPVLTLFLIKSRVSSILKPFISASSLAQKKEDFLNRAVSIYHPCGTCSLGQNPDHNPVDLDFKLQGFQNLWVADASTFPSIPSGNINSAVMMMALKAASSISTQINNKINKFR